MKKVLSYFKNYVFPLIIVFIVKFIGTALDLVIPYLLSYILDNVIPTVTKENYMPIIWYGLIMIGCSALAFILSVKANQLASNISSKCTFSLRNDLFTKIQSLSARQIDEVSIPSLITRVSTDTYNVHQFYNMMQRLGLRAPILLIGGLIASFLLDVKLTLVLLCAIPVIFLVSFLVAKFGIPVFQKIQYSQDSLVRTLRENLEGIRVIKALSKEDHEKKRYAKVNKQVIDYELKSGYIMSSLNPSASFIMNLCLAIVILFGGYLILYQSDPVTSTAKIIAMMSYFTMILNSMMALSRMFINFSRAMVSATRITYVLNLDKDLEKEDIQEVSLHYIEMKNVNFSYNGKENNLKDINFTLEENETLGIIGATGSGKTTLLNLLLRFYDTTEGEVFVNYKNVKCFDKEELTSYFGTVFQNDIVFHDTIQGNIDFGRNLKEEDIHKASETACFDEHARSYPNGYEEMMLAKGSNLSGGQKQRLLIARALASSPKILILDDASSALDYKTDATIRKLRKKNYGVTTSIVVSQRISSISYCDKIMVIDEGRIVALGTHEELLKTCDIYKEIHASQMGGEDHA